jgi:hypothetical protein
MFCNVGIRPRSPALKTTVVLWGRDSYETLEVLAQHGVTTTSGVEKSISLPRSNQIPSTTDFRASIRSDHYTHSDLAGCFVVQIEM